MKKNNYISKSEIDELKAEVEELKKTIDFKDRLYRGLNGMLQEKEAEMERSRLHTLNDIKFAFDIHSDSSTFCNGYRSLCRMIKEEEEKLTNKTNEKTNEAFENPPIPYKNYHKGISELAYTPDLVTKKSRRCSNKKYVKRKKAKNGR